MEKTNELNKFLSYIHMGTSVYRIYYEHAKEFEDKKLINLIVEIQEIFKTHEEKITKKINELGEEATDSLTGAGLMGLYKEKLKIFNDSLSICINAIKATNMGMISSIKFLNENKELSDEIKTYIKNVINDYMLIQDKLVKHINNEL